jgi:hypothetical protein
MENLRALSVVDNLKDLAEDFHYIRYKRDIIFHKC